MRKLFWIGIVAIAASIGTANAQEKLPRQCQANFAYDDGCLFAYVAGDYVQIVGGEPGIVEKGSCLIAGSIRAVAYAGTATVGCSDTQPKGCDAICEAWSEQPAEEDGIGFCTGNSGRGVGGVFCRSVKGKRSNYSEVTKLPRR